MKKKKIGIRVRNRIWAAILAAALMTGQGGDFWRQLCVCCAGGRAGVFLGSGRGRQSGKSVSAGF